MSTSVTADVLKANGTAISAATTTGTSGSAVVLATSPTLVTPNLGTPSVLVGTNITGIASGLTAGAIVSQAKSATITAATTETVNTIALRDASADISARTYIMNPAYGDYAPNKMVGTSASGQIREMSQVQAQSYLGLGSNAYTSTAYYPNSNPNGFITSSALSPYAPLASPALTGSPTAPTQTAGDNSTKIATTAYVYTATTRQLAEFITNVQNSGSSTTNLYTFTIPANTLVNNGDKIVFYFAGSYASNSNNKLLSIEFGSGFGPVQSTGSGFDWQIHGYLIKESSTTYRISISKEDDVTGGVINGVGTVSSFTSSNIFKLRGDGDATGDITAYSGYLEFKPAAL